MYYAPRSSASVGRSPHCRYASKADAPKTASETPRSQSKNPNVPIVHSSIKPSLQKRGRLNANRHNLSGEHYIPSQNSINAGIRIDSSGNDALCCIVSREVRNTKSSKPQRRQRLAHHNTGEATFNETSPPSVVQTELSMAPGPKRSTQVTKSPRISVTLDIETTEFIVRLSKTHRQSMSGICSLMIQRYIGQDLTESRYKQLSLDLFSVRNNTSQNTEEG